MLSADRFNSFTESTNIGFQAIDKIKSSDVYNTVTNKLQEASEELKETVKGLIQSSGLPIDQIQDTFNDNVRAVKDTFTTLQKITNFGPSDLEKAISEFLPGGTGVDREIQNMFRGLAAQCRDSTMSSLPGFKPFNDNFGCGSPKDGKCGSAQVSGLLNKLTGGAIGAIGRSIQSMLRSVMALAGLGYSGGMCKIFAALTQGLPSNVLQRAAAGVLATVGGLGNTTAVLDIASSITGIAGVNPSREISGLVGRITENLTIPGNYVGAQFGDLYDGVMSAYDDIKPGFNVAADGIASVASLGKSFDNGDFKTIASSWLGSSSNTASTTVPYAPQGFETAVGYLTGKSNVVSSAKNLIGSLFG